MKDFLESQDWLNIKRMFAEEIIKLEADIPYKDKDNDFIAKRYVANREARNVIVRVLKKVESKVIEVKKEKQSYK